MTKVLYNMEDHFNPGFKVSPAVHIGSQTHPMYHNVPLEQSYEGFHLAAVGENDVLVVRNMDPDYLSYWEALMGKVNVIVMNDADQGEYISNIILERPDLIEKIKSLMNPSSKLMVYLPTELEERLANSLGIPLHASPKISELYGTKSGIRTLAQEIGIPMPPGIICKTKDDVNSAIKELFENYQTVVLKHDLSSGGKRSKLISSNDHYDVQQILDEVSGGNYEEEKDIVVVEAWLNTSASLCGHIEIIEGEKPYVCAGWQQILDADQVTYMGAGPLNISEKAFSTFKEQLNTLANALASKGAFGSYGPDFLVITDEEKHGIHDDTCLLLELNARVPLTPFPLEVIRKVRGSIGSGFFIKEIKTNKKLSAEELLTQLKNAELLITKKDKDAHGVVPYNIGLLPWGSFYVIAIAPTYDEAVDIVNKVSSMFA